ncbi:MAG TPA: hypothetical protein VGZ00_07635 [Candidatus Baltobacteraceae bacterium]|jgi:hypothetical protein|nr:hypothetical protein [Candidatus Baltobacteraceae bacterium]
MISFKPLSRYRILRRNAPHPFLRAISLVFAAFFCIAGSVCADPQTTPTPVSASSPASASRLRSVLDISSHPLPAHPAGTADGVVTQVNYSTGVMVVRQGSRTFEIVVLPSTPIVGSSSEYFTFSDIRRGVHVHVLMNQRGDIFVAQMIDVR